MADNNHKDGQINWRALKGESQSAFLKESRKTSTRDQTFSFSGGTAPQTPQERAAIRLVQSLEALAAWQSSADAHAQILYTYSASYKERGSVDLYGGLFERLPFLKAATTQAQTEYTIKQGLKNQAGSSHPPLHPAIRTLQIFQAGFQDDKRQLFLTLEDHINTRLECVNKLWNRERDDKYYAGDLKRDFGKLLKPLVQSGVQSHTERIILLAADRLLSNGPDMVRTENKASGTPAFYTAFKEAKKQGLFDQKPVKPGKKRALSI